MSPYSIPTLIGSLLAFGIGVFVLSKDLKSKVNQNFASFSLLISGWLAFFTVSYSTKDIYVAALLGRIGCTLVDFAAPFLYNFVVNFLRLEKEKRFVYLTYFLTFGLFILSFATPYIFLPDPRIYYWGYYPNAGPLHFLEILLHFFIMIRIIVLLYIFLKNHPAGYGRFYDQVKYMYWGSWILFFPGLTDYIPKYGVEIYPFGWMFITMFCILVGYAIVKHQLMDIKIVVRQTLVYSFLVGLLTAVFVVMIMLLEKFFEGFAGYRSLMISMLMAFIIALSFNPIKNMIQNFIDRYFFKGTAEEIAQENMKLHQELLKQDKMKAVATFAASVAHEMRNPLTIVKTFTEFLPEKHDDKDFIDKFARLVKPEVEKINYTLEQLLSFSKPSPSNFKAVDICQVLREVTELLNSDFLRFQIKAHTQFSDEEMIVMADLGQLKQVFLNLFLNSIDAMPLGGNIFISGHPVEKGSVEISIRDTGCGISNKNIKNIFQPFFTTKPNGTGLGLSIIKDIIDQHKASIRVQSEQGKGTEFIIRFPVANKTVA